MILFIITLILILPAFSFTKINEDLNIPDTGVIITNLRCEYMENPLGIDETSLRLSWILESGERGQKQNGYQILVASKLDLLKQDKADLWDSGHINSNQSLNIIYTGHQLQSRMNCYWKVRIWDKDNAISPWSEPAFWEIGLLHPEDWKAGWIAAPDLQPVNNNYIDSWIQQTASDVPKFERKEQIIDRLTGKSLSRLILPEPYISRPTPGKM